LDDESEEEEDEDSLKLERVSGSLFESGVRPQPMIMSQRLPVQEVHALNIERIQSRIDSDDSDNESEMEEINGMEDDDGMIKTEYHISSGVVTLPESSIEVAHDMMYQEWMREEFEQPFNHTSIESNLAVHPHEY